MVTKDIGFVIKRYNFRETSLIATLYTLQFGKIVGIFKGFYTRKKEFSSTLDLFTLNEFLFYPKKREVWLVSFADLISEYHFLRNNILKNKIGTVFLNLLDKTIELWDVHQSVFYLLKDSLDYLSKEDAHKVLYTFLVKFLTLSGFKPELNLCINCHRQLKDDIFFSTSRGGLLCTNCLRGADDYQKIGRETASSLLYIQNNDFPLALRLSSTLSCEKEMRFILREFLSYHLELDVLGQVF